jgi:hypothetical protein
MALHQGSYFQLINQGWTHSIIGYQDRVHLKSYCSTDQYNCAVFDRIIKDECKVTRNALNGMSLDVSVLSKKTNTTNIYFFSMNIEIIVKHILSWRSPRNWQRGADNNETLRQKRCISTFPLWTFHLYVATFQQHLYNEYISLSWFDIQELVVPIMNSVKGGCCYQ